MMARPRHGGGVRRVLPLPRLAGSERVWDLLPWELNRGGADSTLRHCEDLTEQRLLQLHHLSPLPFSWCSSSSPPMDTVATTPALFLLFLAEALLGLEFLEFSCGHGDAGGGAAVELPAGSKMGRGGHHVMIHIWQRQRTRLAFARSGLLQGIVERSLLIFTWLLADEDGWIWAS